MICRPDFAAAARRDARLPASLRHGELAKVVPFRSRGAVAVEASEGGVSGTLWMLGTVAVLNVAFWALVGNVTLHSIV